MKDSSAARRTRHDDGLTLRPCLVPLPSTRMVLRTTRLASARALRMCIPCYGATEPRCEPGDLRAQAGFLQAAPPAKQRVHPLSETHPARVATQSRRTLQSKSPAKHRSVDVTGPLLRRCVLTGRPRSPVRVGSCLPPVPGTATIDADGTGHATTGIRACPLHAHLFLRSGRST